LLRWADSGTLAVHTAPFHPCVHAAAVSMTSGVSGKKSSVLPRKPTGRPWTVNCKMLPSTRTLLSGTMPVVPAMIGRGWALAAASKAAPWMAVELLTGTLRLNSPSSGMHSFLQTSQAALSLISMS
jgi:hypothetical protein